MAQLIFKVGDAVQLKVGVSPVMSVANVPKSEDDLLGQGGLYKCQWFSGKKLESGLFRFEQLKPAEPEK